MNRTASRVLAGAEFLVNTYTAGVQDSPVVASAEDGSFVVAWRRDSDGNLSGVFARRFERSGTPIGGEFRVNAYTTGAQINPDLAAEEDGSFVVVWGGGGATDTSGVFGRRFDAAGAPIGGEFAVNSATGAPQRRPAVALTGSGTFVVAFESGTNLLDIFARQFDAAGAPLATEFRVNTHTTEGQWFASVAARPNGDFVVVWESVGQDGDESGVYARRYSTGGPTSDEIPVNSYTTDDQQMPRVAMDAAGNFFVTWQGDGQDGSSGGAIGRYFLGPDNLPGPELVVNSYTTSWQEDPAVTMDPDGRVVVAWTSLSQDGDDDGVFAQRFLPERIFADGFDSATLSAWSSAATSDGDLAPSPDAALAGSLQGLRAVVDDTTGRYVEDGTPDGEGRYRARFHFDTNGFDPGEAGDRRRIRLFIVFEANPLRRVCAIVLRRLNGQYSLAGRARRDDDSQQNTGFIPITDGEHVVELDWKRASGPDAEDGAFEMWIDGTSVYATTTLDSSISAVDLVRLGALTLKPGANGTIYVDEFDSRRTGYIGP